MLQVLSEEDADRVNAAVSGIETFVDTLMLVTKTQNDLDEKVSAEGTPPADAEPPAEPMNVDSAPTAQVGTSWTTLL